VFYDVYKNLCQEKGVSVTKAATEIGLSKSHPTAWKKRGLTPNGDTLNKIAEYFGVSVDRLLGNFGALDPVLPANMQGANLNGAKVDKDFLDYMLHKFSSLDRNTVEYVTTRNNLLNIAKSSGLGDRATKFFDNLERKEKRIAISDTLSSDYIPYVRGRRFPILGSVPAGVPILAAENIEGYDFADVPEGDDYFFLHIKGNSMINAHIYDGDLVLVKMQNCAENGNIVVCLVNGDEATLKRFTQQNDMVILQPENPEYQPILVSCKDFETGYARIIGVAVEVKHRLL